MSSTGKEDVNTSSTQAAFDRAYYVHALNQIDQNIVKLLRSAGEAVQALTLQTDNKSELTIEDRKSAFTKATSDYFGALSYVDVNLRRQIYALEEANIIPVDIPKEVVAADGAKAVVGSGAMGNLDVGWLNSRNDKVGTDMEAELWTQAKDLLTGFDIDALFAKVDDNTAAAVPL
ncbi:MAG: hypothetical protein GOMPHAMPRED_008256 [Gomphillus americanus]|uniref:Mediator of RNA polymerase II transcription subunit 11 n=1 Tax=Gomphillus americanus TaxID=1940652 RepID=A0A8H3I4K2_9LECA|nr:MAG: hypothetical protein GOMPHAMPRED_008256 [Gomphillus americanus]